MRGARLFVWLAPFAALGYVGLSYSAQLIINAPQCQTFEIQGNVLTCLSGAAPPPVVPPVPPTPIGKIPERIDGIKVDFRDGLTSDVQRYPVGDLRDRILVVRVIKGTQIKIYEFDGGTALARYVWITDDPSGTPIWRRGDGGAIRAGQFFVVKPYKAGQFSGAAVSVY